MIVDILNFQPNLEGTNMVGRLATLTAGMAVGILLMLVLQRPTGSSDETTTTATIRSRTDELPKPIGPGEPGANNVDDDANFVVESAPPTDEFGPADDQIGIPSVYRKLIGPVRPRDLSFEAKHALFEKERRDEAWAYAMETGINDHIATFGAGEGVVIEYVECRSRYCEVGGYAIEGYKVDFSMVWGDMVRSEWWQASGGYEGRGGGEAPGRFLAIIPRNDRQ